MNELNKPEIIGNQEYFKYDTVSCVSTTGETHEGFLQFVGNSCYIKIIKKETLFEFRYHTINPLRRVLIEKCQKVSKWDFEASNTQQEDFFQKFNRRTLLYQAYKNIVNNRDISMDLTDE